MKLSQADENVFTTLFGKEVFDKLSGALKSDDGELSLGAKINGRVISQEDETKLKTTLTDAGIEIGYKKLSKAAGIELASGEKDAEIIAGKIKIGITAILEKKYEGQTPSDELKASQKKVTDLEASHNKLLQTYEQSKVDLEESNKKFSGLQTEMKTTSINNTILSAFPDKMKQDKTDALWITTKSFDFSQEREIDGKMTGVIIDRLTDSIVTNQLGEPEKTENVIKAFVEKKGWVKGKGMGGGDRPGESGLPKGMSDDAAMKYIEEAGKDPMSSEGSEMFTELTKSA